MSAFSGPQHKGAMRDRRTKKRKEAEARNASADARRYICGHVHGASITCPPEQNRAEQYLLREIFGHGGHPS